MKKFIKFFTGALMIATLVITACKVQVESLTQEEMVSQLDKDSKNKVFDEILAGKNADELLAKLSDEQKTAILDKMLTDEKKTEIYTEKLTASEKAKIFDEILADKRTADTFLSLLTDAEKQAVYNEKLTTEEKAKIFNEIFADKRTNGKVVDLLNDTEKTAVFDALLSAKTSTDFIVEILTKQGNETVYEGVKDYITDNLTQAELTALLNKDTKSSIFDEILAGKNADELLAKLSDEQKAAIFDEMLTDEKKTEIYTEKLTASEKAKIFDEILADKRTADTFLELLTDDEKQTVYNEKLTADEKAKIFNEIFEDKRTNGKVVDLLDNTEKTAVFDDFLIANTSKGFFLDVLKTLIYTEKLTMAELTALFDVTDKTAPRDVTNLTASPGINSVRLNWTDGPDIDNDLYGYLVSWEKVTSSRSITAIEKDSMVVAKSSNTDNSNGVTISDLTGGRTYSFTVQAVDLIGNKSTGVNIEATADEAPFIPNTMVKISGTTEIPDFYISNTELTYAKWYEVYQWAVKNGYTFQDLGREGNSGRDGAEPTENSNQPVTMVSWRDAIIWCNAVSEMEGFIPYYYVEGTTDFTDKTKVVRIAEDYDSWGTNKANTNTAKEGEGTADKAVCNTASKGYRLPTEAEWEYAAKGGENFTYSGSDIIDDVAWYKNNSEWYTDNSETKTYPVGILAPNKYGLNDMSGNVLEWCWDFWDIWSSFSSCRVCRGGGWGDDAGRCAVSFRCFDYPYCLFSDQGFRVCRSSSK